MNITLLVILSIYGILNLVMFTSLAMDYHEEEFTKSKVSIFDRSVGEILIVIFFSPTIIAFQYLYIPFITLCRSRPFKKSRFQVGELVSFAGKEWTIHKNEKMLEGDNVVLDSGDITASSWNRYYNVKASDVKKVSKLQKALK